MMIEIMQIMMFTIMKFVPKTTLLQPSLFKFQLLCICCAGILHFYHYVFVIFVSLVAGYSLFGCSVTSPRELEQQRAEQQGGGKLDRADKYKDKYTKYIDKCTKDTDKYQYKAKCITSSGMQDNTTLCSISLFSGYQDVLVGQLRGASKNCQENSHGTLGMIFSLMAA